jgi:hypothetical protein
MGQNEVFKLRISWNLRNRVEVMKFNPIEFLPMWVGSYFLKFLMFHNSVMGQVKSSVLSHIGYQINQILKMIFESWNLSSMNLSV